MLTYTRKPFSKETKRAALLRSGGLCEGNGPIVNLPKDVRCNFPFGVGVEYDHSDAADNQNVTLENCQCLCVRCHAFKTFKRDIPMHAKVKRQSDKHNGINEAKGRPMPGTKASGLRKKLNGSVERR